MLWVSILVVIDENKMLEVGVLVVTDEDKVLEWVS